MRLALISVLATTLLAACAGYRPSDAVPFSETSKTREGYAKLYIFRPHNRREGSAIWPDIYIGDKRIVELKDQAYTVLFVRPGRYVLSVKKGHPLWFGSETFPFEIANVADHFLLYNTYKDTWGITGVYPGAPRWQFVDRRSALEELKKTYFVPPALGAVEP